jgi:RNA polymerase sigma-70 factor (ECF subfamily)
LSAAQVRFTSFPTAMPNPSPPLDPGAVTVLLNRIRLGDRATLTALMEVVYPELRKLAQGLLRRERPGHVLQPTALVNEAYIRLVGNERHNWQNRAHFFAAAAHVMRRILVDYARAAQAKKRSGDSAQVVLDAFDVVSEHTSTEIIELDQALRELEQVSSRQAKIVELRYFGGLTVPETAEALGMNPRTVDRDWAAARVWLRRRLRP